MNVPPFYDNYIDATNEFIGGGGGGDTIIIDGGGTLNDYLFITNNSNLIINNPKIDGEIKFKTLFNYSGSNYGTIIDKTGRLYVYHNYKIIQPLITEGYLNVEDELAGLKQSSIVADGEMVFVQAEIAGINTTLLLHTSEISKIGTEVELHREILQTIVDYEFYEEVFFSGTGGLDRITAEAVAVSSFTNRKSLIEGILGGATFVVLGAFVSRIYEMIELDSIKNIYSNVNSNILSTSEREPALSNLTTAQRNNYINLGYEFSNLSINYGFINSNILQTQLIPNLKTNKIMVGNITTPNSFYNIETDGNINANMIYINSTSLTTLLNEKQNNLLTNAPIYLSGGAVGLNYANSLELVNGNLSVKAGTQQASKWTSLGNDIYNNNSGNIGVGTATPVCKFEVNGEFISRSNLHIANTPLNFINSYTNAVLTPITGTNESYLLYSGNGNLILNEGCACDLLVVGAGGNGGAGAGSGGGGAGEVIYYPNFPLRAGTLNINVGVSSSVFSNRTSKITLSGGADLITAKGGGNGGSVLYTTSGGTVSAITAITGTNDAYITITAGTTLTLNKSLTCDILVVGGGGGGGGALGGGGGSGAVLYITNLTIPANTYSITVGSGGAGGTGSENSTSVGTNGGNSSITIGGTTYTAVGGGGGGYRNSSAIGTNGINGGSGGGGSHTNGTTRTSGGSSNKNTYSGWTSLGNSGSRGISFDSTINPNNKHLGGAGGGAGSGGYDAYLSADKNTGFAGNGGDGINLSSIFGTSVGHNGWFSGGGGGSIYSGDANTNAGFANGGNGLFGGGGNGSGNNGANGINNTGGGGGAGGHLSTGGNGGSGVVIIKFINYYTEVLPATGGSGGGGVINQLYALSGVKFDEYKSYVSAGFSGTSTKGGNGGSALTINRYTTTITGSSLSVGGGGSGITGTPTPVVKTNYGDGGDGNSGNGFQGVIIIRFKEPLYLQVRGIKDNANTGLIINANEGANKYNLRLYPWSDTFQLTGIPTRGYSFRVQDGNNNLDLLNLFSSFGGRIGVKTKNPLAVLDVNGDINCKTLFVNADEQYGVSCQITNQNAIGEVSITLIGGQATSYGNCAILYNPATNLGTITSSKSLQIKTARTGSYIYIDDTTGYVGIGLTNPQSKLELVGDINSTSMTCSTGNMNSISTYGLALNNGNITGVNKITSVEVQTGPVKASSLDLDGGNITNGGFFYGMAQQARFLNMTTGEWHYDTQSRNRFYFTNDGNNSHTVFRTGSTSHYFQDKDATDYAILDRFGISTYFEVISGGGYDNIGVLDASVTGVYVYRRLLVRLSTFTEVHRCFCEDELYLNYDDFINEFVGCVVVSKGKIKTALKEADKNWEILEGKDGITIDDSHPVVELSRKKKDKAVVGVITKRNQNNDLSGRLVINSLGETGIWVVNTNGTLENGDYLQTSDMIGYAEKQDDDIMRNYTIGKIMINCSFELDNPNYKCEVINIDKDLRRAFLPIFIYSG